jgi:hypothetical protein
MGDILERGFILWGESIFVLGGVMPPKKLAAQLFYSSVTKYLYVMNLFSLSKLPRVQVEKQSQLTF